MKPSPHTSMLVIATAALMAGLAPRDAHASSRTVHIRTRVINHTGTDVYVHVRGDYIKGPLRMTHGEGAVGTVAFDGDEFGSPARADNVTGLAFRAEPDNDMTRNIENDSKYSVTTGHTHHFTATFYEKEGNSYRAFALYEWIAQVNRKGVNKCRPVKRIDPEQRLLGLHKRPELIGYQKTVLDNGFTVNEIQGVIAPALTRRGLNDLQGRSASNYANLYRQRNHSTFGAIETFGELVKTGPGTCLTQLWVLPAVPEDRRTPIQIGMLGWGAADYSFVGDFNGDGMADLASASGRYLFMAPSRGPWRWDRLKVDTGHDGWGAAAYTYAVDLDGDNKADIASIYRDKVFVRRAANGFKAETWPVPNAWGASGYTWAADFTGDGKSDLLTGIDGDRLYLRGSTGTSFSSYKLIITPKKWGEAAYTRIGDFNGDGKADIASIYKGTVFMRLATGTDFTFAEWEVPNVWGAAGYTFVGDFNGDGKDDIATAVGGNSIVVNLSTGSGFVQKKYSVPSQWGEAPYTRVGDFNGDGRTDIASASRGTVYLNLAKGSQDHSVAGFQGFTRESWAVADWWGQAGYTFIGDFDKDGKSDIATAADGEVQVKIRR